jgi:predicted PurR-regulated permease PerM
VTPLHAWLSRFLPRPLATLALAACYAAVLLAVILCLNRPTLEFIYL